MNKIIYAQRASGIIYRFVRTFNKGTYILPANICPIVPLTLKLANVNFEFVDINQETLCLDEIKCRELILINPRKYEGVIFVRTYGHIYDTTSFFDSLKFLNEKLKIIDDRCLCMPELNEKLIGSDLILFSTGYAKPMDFGKGGIGILNNSLTICKYDISFSKESNIEKYYKEALNANTKINSIPESWLDINDYDADILVYVNRIELEKQKIDDYKSKINQIYYSLLPTEIVMPISFQNWRFNIQVDNNKLVIKKIFENNLFASSHYKPANVLFDNSKFPVAELIYSRVINLFNDYYFSEHQAELACRIINKFI
jgi:dTDP-4-amino-4,6-dideoxygalactose transaminase